MRIGTSNTLESIQESVLGFDVPILPMNPVYRKLMSTYKFHDLSNKNLILKELTSKHSNFREKVAFLDYIAVTREEKKQQEDIEKIKRNEPIIRRFYNILRNKVAMKKFKDKQKKENANLGFKMFRNNFQKRRSTVHGKNPKHQDARIQREHLNRKFEEYLNSSSQMNLPSNDGLDSGDPIRRRMSSTAGNGFQNNLALSAFTKRGSQSPVTKQFTPNFKVGGSKTKDGEFMMEALRLQFALRGNEETDREERYIRMNSPSLRKKKFEIRQIKMEKKKETDLKLKNERFLKSLNNSKKILLKQLTNISGGYKAYKLETARKKNGIGGIFRSNVKKS